MHLNKVGKIIIWIMAWMVLSLLFAYSLLSLGIFDGKNSAEFETAYVLRVIDGDTIELKDGRIIRYIGIDTPETVHPTKGVECFGFEATERNKQLVEGKFVELLSGVENIDKYGRTLKYVFVDGIFVNAELVAEGFGRQMSYGKEIRFEQVFVQLQEYSISRNQGLWKNCQ